MTTAAYEQEKRPEAVENACRGQCYVPHVDVYETKNELVLTADIPGSTAEEIDVHYEDGELRIHAKVPPRGGEGRKYLLQEYGVGDFYRTFKLGQEVDASRIEAQVNGGTLVLRLPKVEAVRPRKITVKGG